MTQKVYKTRLPVDDKAHSVPGKPVHIDLQDGRVHVWSIAQFLDHGPGASSDVHTNADRRLRIYGTGHSVPDQATYIGSVADIPWVWHVFDVTDVADITG